MTTSSLPTRSWRTTLVALFPSTDPGMSGWKALGVLVAAWAVAAVRLGRSIRGASIWAEDGVIFWAQDRSGVLPELLLSPYAGYVHVGPRLLIWMVDRLPMADAAVGVALAAAAVQATAAWTGYLVVRAHLRRTVPALLVAAVVAVVPVGPEVVLNLANIQWFLLFAGVVVQLWSPLGPAGWCAQLALGMSLALSSPFGALGAAVAVLRAMVLPRRATVAAAGLLVAAATTQAVVMARAGSTRLKPDLSVDAIAGGYLRRVVADGILGVGRVAPGEMSSSVLLGAVLLAGFAVLFAVAARQHGRTRVVAVLGVMGLSVLTYAAPVVITGLRTTDPYDGGRYFLAPALLWLVALVMVLPHVSAEGRGVWTARLVTGALVLALGAGIWTSFWAPRLYRMGAPAWVAQLGLAQQECAELAPEATVAIGIAPQGWTVTVPCSVVESDPAAGGRS